MLYYTLLLLNFSTFLELEIHLSSSKESIPLQKVLENYYSYFNTYTLYKEFLYIQIQHLL